MLYYQTSRPLKKMRTGKGWGTMALAPDDKKLSGMRVLVVEDEYFIAADVAKALEARGAEVVGPVGTLEDATRAVESERIDKAVLDMNLRGNMAYAIADRLEDAGISYVISTGYGADNLPERLRDKPRIEKPFDPETLAELIAG